VMALPGPQVPARKINRPVGHPRVGRPVDHV
jgi:hypothetical protein